MNPLQYLINTLINAFSLLLLLRFFMQVCRVSFANPLGQLTITLTDPLVKRLRRVLPSVAGFDWASLLPAYLVLPIPYLLFALSPLGQILWFALLDLICLVLYLFEFALIIHIVLSWVAPSSPLCMPVRQLTAPLLRPVRRVLPPISGIDLSPLLVILLLQTLVLTVNNLRVTQISRWFW